MWCGGNGGDESARRGVVQVDPPLAEPFAERLWRPSLGAVSRKVATSKPMPPAPMKATLAPTAAPRNTSR